MWNDSKIINFIKDRTNSMEDMFLPRRLIELENNPLQKEYISREAILLREKLDEIQGNDKDTELVGQIVSAITLGSKIEPIPKDHPYTSEEVGEYLKYLNELDEYNKLVDDMQKNGFDSYGNIKVPIMSVLQHRDNGNMFIVMSSNENTIRQLGIDEMDNILGDKYMNRVKHFNIPTDEELNEFLYNIDFEELRKRLINSGFKLFVEEINEHLEFY